jgi:hypothetical protein
MPSSVRADTAAWREASDIGYQFANEHLELDPHSVIPSTYMAEKFNEFLEGNGKKKWSAQLISTRLPKSVEAALGREVAPGQLWVQARHTLGLADPFDAHRHTLLPGKNIRAWEGVRFRHEDEARPEPAPQNERVSHEAPQGTLAL